MADERDTQTFQLYRSLHWKMEFADPDVMYFALHTLAVLSGARGSRARVRCGGRVISDERRVVAARLERRRTPPLPGRPSVTRPPPPRRVAPAMSDSQDETHAQTPEILTYDPKPSLRHASAVALQAGMAGALVSAIQNALGSHNRGAAGVFTRTGGTIGFFGAFLCRVVLLGTSRDLHGFIHHSCDGIHLRVHGIRCCQPKRKGRCVERRRRRMCGGFPRRGPR